MDPFEIQERLDELGDQAVVDPAKALRALELFATDGQPPEVSHELAAERAIRIAMCLARLDRLETAATALGRVDSDPNDAHGRTLALAHLAAGLIQHRLGDHHKALARVSRALDLCDALEDADAIAAEAHLFLAVINQRLNQPGTVRAHLVRAAAGADRSGGIWVTAMTHLASLSMSEGDTDAAMDGYRASLEGFRRLGSRLGIGWAFQNLADAAWIAEDAQGALAYSDASLDLLLGRDGGPPVDDNTLSAYLWLTRALVLLDLDPNNEAEECAHKSLSAAIAVRSTARQARALDVLAECQLAAGRPDLALNYTSQSLALGDAVPSAFRTDTYGVIAQAYAEQDDTARALTSLQLAQAALGSSPDHGRWMALSRRKVHVLERLEHWPEAMAALRERAGHLAALHRSIARSRVDVTRLEHALDVEKGQRQAAQAAKESLARQLLHAQRLETMGLLAATLAHDVNNALTVILGHADMLNSGGDRDRLTQGIAKAASEAGRQTRRLLDFSHATTTELQDTDLRRPKAGVDEPPAAQPAPNHAPTVGATVLVVDDTAEVRAMTAHHLRESGHEVVECAGGQAALDQLSEHPDRFDLVLSDLQMAPIDGLALYSGMRKRGYTLPFILISGGTSGPEQLPDGVRFLPKPFASAELLATVHSMLATQPEAGGLADD